MFGQTIKPIIGDPFDIVPDLCKVIKEKLLEVIDDQEDNNPYLD